jgi:hypothetical protein
MNKTVSKSCGRDAHGSGLVDLQIKAFPTILDALGRSIIWNRSIDILGLVVGHCVSGRDQGWLYFPFASEVTYRVSFSLDGNSGVRSTPGFA